MSKEKVMRDYEGELAEIFISEEKVIKEYENKTEESE